MPERARRDRALRARDDVRPGPVRLHGEDGRRPGHRRPARPRPPARRDGRAGRRAQGHRRRRRDGRRARPPAPRGGHRGDPRGGRARAPDHRRRRLRARCSPSSPDRPVDLLWGIGGTPEGVISAAAIKCSAAGWSAGCGRATTPSAGRASTAGYDLDRTLTQDDLVKGDDCFFSATGVTDGDVLAGRPLRGHAAARRTESLVMRSRSGTVRRIHVAPRPRQAARAHRLPLRLSVTGAARRSAGRGTRRWPRRRRRCRPTRPRRVADVDRRLALARRRVGARRSRSGRPRTPRGRSRASERRNAVGDEHVDARLRVRVEPARHPRRDRRVEVRDLDLDVHALAAGLVGRRSAGRRSRGSRRRRGPAARRACPLVDRASARCRGPSVISYSGAWKRSSTSGRCSSTTSRSVVGVVDADQARASRARGTSSTCARGARGVVGVQISIELVVRAS